jgi:ABC-type transport system involved in multi-copper enzyme maturation permease subunit
MRPLLWKEWHEQRWKLGFGCVVLCAFALIGLRTRIVPDQSIIIGACGLGVLMLPILSAAGLFPAERGEGTLDMLLALPVTRARVLAAKAILGTALCAGPLLAAAMLSILVAGGREISASAMLAIFLRAMASGVFLFVWMFGFTVRSPSEGRGAALALGILVSWLIITSGLIRSTHQAGYGFPESHAPLLLWLPCPFVFVFPPTSSATVLGIIVQAAIALVLCLLTARAMKITDSEARP